MDDESRAFVAPGHNTTVQELITALQTLPSTALVRLEGGELDAGWMYVDVAGLDEMVMSPEGIVL